MRICSPELGIAPGSNSGGEVHDREILKALAKLGIEIDVLLPKGRPYHAEINQWHVQHACIKQIFPPALFNFLVIPFILKTFRHNHFDILRIHSPYYVGIGAWIAKKFLPDIPLITTYHHLEPKNLFFNIVDRLLINRWDRIITVSEFTRREILERYHVAPHQVVSIHNGVDPRFKPQPRNQKLVKQWDLDGKKTILFLGGLKQRKNLPFLIDIFAHLNRTDTILLLAGAGSQRYHLQKRVAKLGMQNKVKFTGYIAEENKVDVYNLADIFVLPSQREGFGMVAAEAMSCGRCVIVPDALAFREYITHEKESFLLPPNNKEAWIKQLNILLENEPLRKYIGQQARKRVLHDLSWENAARKHIEVFRQALREKELQKTPRDAVS